MDPTRPAGPDPTEPIPPRLSAHFVISQHLDGKLSFVRHFLGRPAGATLACWTGPGGLARQGGYTEYGGGGGSGWGRVPIHPLGSEWVQTYVSTHPRRLRTTLADAPEQSASAAAQFPSGPSAGGGAVAPGGDASLWGNNVSPQGPGKPEDKRGLR
eukprot:gene25767-biopygen21016